LRTSVRFRPAEPWSQAGPRPLLGPGAQARADGIEADVVEHRAEVLVRVDRPGPEAVAEEVAAAFVPPVEAQGVRAVQELHAAGELLHGRLEDEVVVRGHQAVGVELPAEALACVAEEREEGLAVDAVAVDGGVIDAERRHVEDAVVEDAAQESWHESDRNARSSRRGPRRTIRHAFVSNDASGCDNPAGLTPPADQCGYGHSGQAPSRGADGSDPSRRLLLVGPKRTGFLPASRRVRPEGSAEK
jgi:hypothetical protein